MSHSVETNHRNTLLKIKSDLSKHIKNPDHSLEFNTSWQIREANAQFRQKVALKHYVLKHQKVTRNLREQKEMRDYLISKKREAS